VTIAQFDVKPQKSPIRSSPEFIAGIKPGGLGGKFTRHGFTSVALKPAHRLEEKCEMVSTQRYEVETISDNNFEPNSLSE
jgi:hypothetical protein